MNKEIEHLKKAANHNYHQEQYEIAMSNYQRLILNDEFKELDSEVRAQCLDQYAISCQAVATMKGKRRQKDHNIKLQCLDNAINAFNEYLNLVIEEDATKFCFLKIVAVLKEKALICVDILETKKELAAEEKKEWAKKIVETHDCARKILSSYADFEDDRLHQELQDIECYIHCMKGDQAYDKKEYDKGIEHYQAAIRIYEGFIKIHESKEWDHPNERYISDIFSLADLYFTMAECQMDSEKFVSQAEPNLGISRSLFQRLIELDQKYMLGEKERMNEWQLFLIKIEQFFDKLKKNPSSVPVLSPIPIDSGSLKTTESSLTYQHILLNISQSDNHSNKETIESLAVSSKQKHLKRLSETTTGKRPKKKKYQEFPTSPISNLPNRGSFTRKELEQLATSQLMEIRIQQKELQATLLIPLNRIKEELQQGINLGPKQ